MAKQKPDKRAPFVVDDRIRKMIAGAVAEVDPAQIAVLRRLTPAERLEQMLSMIRLTEKSAAKRLCSQEPVLNEREALRIVRSGELIPWLIKQRTKKQSMI